MRILRIGTPETKASQNVHAALVSWRRGEQVRGGIALIGTKPPGCKRMVDAVLILPRGMLVVVGVDLPDPAKRLEAPVDGPWLADGWPLIDDNAAGAVNPAHKALNTASAAVRSLGELLGEPPTSCAVLAVGPYAGEVITPPADLARGIRVLFPEPGSLREAADQLGGEVFTYEQVRRVLATLAPREPVLSDAALHEEGFVEHRPRPPAPAREVHPQQAQLVTAMHRPEQERPWWRRKPSWLPFALGGVLAVGALGLVLLAGGGTSTPASASGGPPPVTVDGSTYQRMSADNTRDCAAHAYGDAQLALQQAPCTRLARAVYVSKTGERAASVALATVTFGEPEAARRFHETAAKPGAGGITDLVAEGRRWTGAPHSFDDAAFTTLRDGTRVRIGQAVYTARKSDPDDPALTKLATDALHLPG